MSVYNSDFFSFKYMHKAHVSQINLLYNILFNDDFYLIKLIKLLSHYMKKHTGIAINIGLKVILIDCKSAIDNTQKR